MLAFRFTAMKPKPASAYHAPFDMIKTITGLIVLAVALGATLVLAFTYQRDFQVLPAAFIRTGFVTQIRSHDPQSGEKSIIGYVLLKTLEDKDLVDGGGTLIAITDKTRIVKDNGANRSPAAFEDLRTGQQVELLIIPPGRGVYPAQPIVTKITILKF